MSLRRLSNIDCIPIEISKAFRNADEAVVSEVILWREVAARMVLDALGYTGLTGEPEKHDATVKEARRWFRGIPDTQSPMTIFDYANMTGYYFDIKKAVLEYPVTYMMDAKEEETERYLDGDTEIDELEPDFIS